MGCAGSRDRRCYGLSVARPAPTNFGALAGNGEERRDAGATAKGGGGAEAAAAAAQELPKLKRSDTPRSFLDGTFDKGKGDGAEGGKKPKQKVKPLNSMSLLEAMEIVTATKERLEEARQRGYAPKTVYAKFNALVGDTAATLPLAMRMYLQHLSAEEASKELAELKAPANTACSISIDIPVAAGPKAIRNAGRVMGKIFLLLDQKDVEEQLQQMLPALIAKTRALTKNEHGEPVVRISIFLSSTFQALEKLTLVDSLDVRVSLGGAGAASAVRVPVAGGGSGGGEAGDEASAAEEKAAMDGAAPGGAAAASGGGAAAARPASSGLKEIEMDTMTPSLFVKLPQQNSLSVHASFEGRVEKQLVKSLKKALTDAGYAPKPRGGDEEDDEEESDEDGEGSQAAAHSLAGILTYLSHVNQIETTMKWESLDDLLSGSAGAASLSRALQSMAKMPAKTLVDSIVAMFHSMPAEYKERAEALYSDLIESSRECFAGFEGLYQVRVLSGRTAVGFTLRGIAPFPLFPSLEDVAVRIRKREEELRRRKAEAEALQSIGPFSDADFDKLLAMATEPIKPPWTRVFPAVESDEDWSSVWVDETDSTPATKARGVLMGVTAEQAFHHFFEPAVRVQWDHFVTECNVVKTFAEYNADLRLTVYATPPSVAQREFLEYTQVRRSKDGILVLARSVIDEAIPESPNRVRGTTLYSGYFFRNVQSKDGKQGTLVTGVLKRDLGGYIPGFMLSQLNTRVLPDWLNLFITTCLRAHSATGYKEFMNGQRAE